VTWVLRCPDGMRKAFGQKQDIASSGSNFQGGLSRAVQQACPDLPHLGAAHVHDRPVPGVPVCPEALVSGPGCEYGAGDLQGAGGQAAKVACCPGVPGVVCAFADVLVDLAAAVPVVGRGERRAVLVALEFVLAVEQGDGLARWPVCADRERQCRQPAGIVGARVVRVLAGSGPRAARCGDGCPEGPVKLAASRSARDSMSPPVIPLAGA